MLASRRTEAVSGLAAAAAVVAPPARGFAKLRLVEKVTHRKHNATFVIAAGGTGGHVLPGLEVAKELRSRGHNCSFVGTPRGLEGRLIPAAGFPIEFVAAGALKQVSMARRFRTFLDMPQALLAAREILEQRRPAAVLGLGGYASGPIMLMALAQDVPVVVLEPNAKPGLANRLAGPFAAWALLGFAEAGGYFAAQRQEFSGIPIRKEFFNLPARTHRAPFTVLVTGGSQGSRRINQAVLAAASTWQAAPAATKTWADERRLSSVRLLHQTGQKEFEEVRAAYKTLGVDAKVSPFFDDMPAAFAEADVVVCRAGASAVAELNAAGKASILVPYPFAADQHQLRNAEAMQQAGATQLVLDSELTGERLTAEIVKFLENPGRLEAMEAASRSRAVSGAAKRAADRLESLAGIS